MKKYYLQAYLHLKTILTREIYGLEGHFFNNYIFLQNAIKNVIKFESDWTVNHKTWTVIKKASSENKKAKTVQFRLNCLAQDHS